MAIIRKIYSIAALHFSRKTLPLNDSATRFWTWFLLMIPIHLDSLEYFLSTVSIWRRYLDVEKSPHYRWYRGVRHQSVTATMESNLADSTVWMTLKWSQIYFLYIFQFFSLHCKEKVSSILVLFFFAWFKLLWAQDSWANTFFMLMFMMVLKIFISIFFINMLTPQSQKGFLSWSLNAFEGIIRYKKYMGQHCYNGTKIISPPIRSNSKKLQHVNQRPRWGIVQQKKIRIKSREMSL